MRYESLGTPQRILIVATLAAIAWYMGWRLSVFNTDAPVFSFILYGAECYGVATLLMHLFMLSRLSVRESPLPPLGVTVDVFIPTLDEAPGIVRRTAIKALAMGYPHATYILDDGDREEIRQLARELGCHYLARGDNRDAKAGNLNFAMKHSSGEFIALFDADHAPKENFLLRTLGFFSDNDVAFVQTPQDFYNLDSYQHRRARNNQVWSEQSLFFRVIQRGKDYWNAAFFCGSCAVIRRSHLESIGGFATGTVTEDLHTSIRLHKHGYRSVYHAESLAFGIAPPQIGPFLSQRVRWGQGAMQVWRKESILLTRKLTAAQKINYIASILTYFDGWQKCIYYLTPALSLLTGWMPIACEPQAFLLHFIPCMALTLWCFEELSRGYGDTLIIEQYNMARFAAFCLATFALFKGKLPFRVTNKQMRAAATHRYLLPQYAVFAINALAIPTGIIGFFATEKFTLFSFSANMLWALINGVLAVGVLVFSVRRARYRREHYRFSIPLVARLITANGHETFVAIDNISCVGSRMLAPKNFAARSGDLLSGEMFLPVGTVQFEAKIEQRRPQESATLSVLACRFIWGSNTARAQLEEFLYGSDFEWRVHRLHERGGTFLQPLPAWYYAENVASMIVMPKTPGDALRTGIICTHHAAGGTAIVFDRLGLYDQFDGSVFTRDGWKPMRARVINENPIDLSNMYLYEWEGMT